MIFTDRKRSLGQGNIFAPVCHSVHTGVCPIACWDTPPGMRGRHPPPGADPPDQRQATPRNRHPQDQRQAPQEQTSLLQGPEAGTLPGSRHPPGVDTPGTRGRHPPGADTPWEQTHPCQSRHPLVQCMLGDTGNRA